MIGGLILLRFLVVDLRFYSFYPPFPLAYFFIVSSCWGLSSGGFYYPADFVFGELKLFLPALSPFMGFASLVRCVTPYNILVLIKSRLKKIYLAEQLNLSSFIEKFGTCLYLIRQFFFILQKWIFFNNYFY